MNQPRMTLDEVIRHFRTTPEFADLVRDAYFDEDVMVAARRFADSEEFAETLRLAGAHATGIVLDIGAGRGIASFAFARAGAPEVIALEPDPSDMVGLGALQQLISNLAIHPLAAYAESLPFPDQTFDLVYARQVLHHIPDLPAAMREVERVLKPGGILFACREHVVDDEAQLQSFLHAHPVNQLAGGENAYSLEEYVRSIVEAGLHLVNVFKPWDNIITAFPAARSRTTLNADFVAAHPTRTRLALKAISLVPGLIGQVRRANADPRYPGRMFAFLARKT